ncbi:MAG: carbon-nitrogen hydrolase family protein [Streptosporangiaceae bacterium]
MTELLRSIRIAAVQAAPVFMNHDATIEKACDLIAEAGKNGADVVGFPENFIPGHPVWFYYHPATSKESQRWAVELFKNALEIPSAATEKLCRVAARSNVNVIIGCTERRSGSTGTLFNTQLFISREGRISGRHRKLVPTVGERVVHAPGDADSQGAVEFDIGQTAGLICGENSNPLAIAALGAQYPYVHVASWPNHFIPAWCGMQETSLLASRNVAYMNKCYVMSSCGTNSAAMVADLPLNDEDRAFLEDPSSSGGSAIIDPLGAIIAGPLPGDQEGILYTDTDPELVYRGRLVHDFAGHYNRADVFQLKVCAHSEPVVRFEARPGPSSALPERGSWQLPDVTPDRPVDATALPLAVGRAEPPRALDA